MSKLATGDARDDKTHTGAMMMRRSYQKILGGALAVACLGIAAGALADDAVVATLGSQPVTASEIKDLMPPLSSASRADVLSDPHLMTKLVRSAYGRKMVLDAALKQGWDKKPEVADQIRRARDDIIIHDYLNSVAYPSATFPSAAEVNEEYHRKKARYGVPAAYHLAQIFIAVPADAPKEVAAAAEKKARELVQEAKAKDADFAALARANSTYKIGAARGGDLGWLTANQMQPKILAAVAALKGEGVTEPVMADGGWHIIDVRGIAPAMLPPLDEVHDRVVSMLRQDKIDDYVEKLFGGKPFTLKEQAAAKLFTPNE
ncbi:MAG TPA: peptidylprolyl isomerase [Stellaceae bacterium]|nr:peptidylprolyl isomerase [Stellaceae bacterium]